MTTPPAKTTRSRSYRLRDASGAVLTVATTVTLILGGGCSARQGPAPGGAATPKATVATPTSAPPTAVLPDGSAIHLELAVTPEEISNGLMFRPTLPSDRGMLFLFSVARVPAFWMKNTLVPLDLVFLNGAGTVVDLIPDVQPCAAEPCPQYVPEHPARAVLELAAGVAAQHHLVVGDTIHFQHVDGYPVEQPPS